MTPVVVDTSLWRAYFSGSSRAGRLGELIDDDDVLLHPFVLGELTLGGLSGRESADLRRLPVGPLVAHDEVLEFVSARRLARRGVGWIDVHLLASALVSDAKLWSFDRALAEVAGDLGLAFSPAAA